MIKLDREFSALKYYGAPLILLLLTDFFIVLNIPFLRQIFGFIYFTVVPGYLILLAIGLNQKLEAIDTILFSVGLSVFILMFLGATSSLICPFFGFSKPLSLNFILIALNVLVLSLSFAVTRMNTPAPNLGKFSGSFLSEPRILILSLIPIVFPFLTVAGTNLVDSTGDSRLVIAGILIMFLYGVIVYICGSFGKLTNRDWIYPLSLYFIGLALLLMYSTCSNYLVDYNDPELEYYLFAKTLMSKIWDPNFLYSPYNACMSITVLPALYQILTNIGGFVIFKVVLQLIIALFPVAVFSILRRYGIEAHTAFILALMCVFQYQYIIKIPTHIRTGIALVFFALVILVLINNKLPEIHKRLLVLIFLFSLVISHYSTAYLTLIFFAVLLTLQLLFVRDFKFATVTTYLFTVLVFWYALIVEPAYASGVKAIEKTITNLNKFFVEEARGESELKVLGYGAEVIAQYIKIITYDLFYALVAIGISIYLIKKFKNKEFDFITLSKYSMLLIFLGFAIAPMATKVYSIERLSLQMLTILVVGVYYAVRSTPLVRNHERTFMIALFALLVFSGTGLNYISLGTSKLSPMYMSQDSAYRCFIYIYDGEIMSGKWLNLYGNHGKVVYGDFVVDSRILLSTLSRDCFIVGVIGNETKKFWQVESYRYFDKRGAMKGDYLYSRFFNIKYKKIYDGQSVHYYRGIVAEEKNMPVNICDNPDLVKVYDNGFSQLYIFTKRIKPVRLLGG